MSDPMQQAAVELWRKALGINPRVRTNLELVESVLR
jgi:hypothetical protein